MESRTIYLTVRVDVTLPDGCEDLTAGDIADSIESVNVLLDKQNPITLDDVEVCGLNDEC